MIFRRSAGNARMLVVPLLFAATMARAAPDGNFAVLSRHDAHRIYRSMPVAFVPNAGQYSPDIRFRATALGNTFLFRDGYVEILTGATRPGARNSIRLSFAGPLRASRPEGNRSGAGLVNYYLGEDPAGWRPGVVSYNRIVYPGLSEGIDLEFEGKHGAIESIYTIQPGASVADIRVRCAGVSSIRLDDTGDLLMASPFGSIRQSRPRAYQDVAGEVKEIAARFRIDSKARTYGFEVIGDYDPTRPLYIDPVIAFSSYLGGNGDDQGLAISVDDSGSIYLAGATTSTDFPVKSPILKTAAGNGDAFIIKLAADGKTLLYATYLGGSDRDAANAVAVDGGGQAFLAGLTYSKDFPIRSAAFGNTRGKGDAFVVKLSSDGALVYSATIGGSDFDTASGIALDSGGAAYAAGQTFSADFPVLSAIQGSLRGVSDAFVIKISPSGQTLSYSTFLGGSGLESANALAVDRQGQLFVAGTTSSLNFPVLTPYQADFAGGNDAFATKLDSTGTKLLFSTYLGGAGDDAANAIFIDSAGVCIAGYTTSSDFPVSNAFQAGNRGGTDAFLLRLGLLGGSLGFSTLLGGSGQDEITALAEDAQGRIYVAGSTSSQDFPQVKPLRTALLGENDAFISEFDQNGQSLLFSTFLGGSGSDSAQGVALDRSGRIHLAGTTRSSDLLTAGAVQSGFRGGNSDAFFLAIDPVDPVYAKSMYFPRLLTHDSESTGGAEFRLYTGLALANPSAKDAYLRFTAFDFAGKPLSGPGIANSVPLMLPARQQFAKVDSQMFGAGLSSKTPPAWFKAESSIPEATAFFLIFDGDLNLLDGADVSSTSLTRAIFPEVEDQGFTQIHLVNPFSGASTATLELIDGNQGNPLASATRAIPPGGALIEGMSTLFPSVPVIRGQYYVRMVSTAGLVPFELLGKAGQYIEGLNGQDPGLGARVVFSPQYAIGGGAWRTTLSLVNYESIETNVTVQLVGDDGTVKGSASVTLPGQGKAQIVNQNALIPSDAKSVTQGYLKITSDRANIGGAVVFGDLNRRSFSSALPLVSKPLSEAVYGQVASDATWFTGLAVLNPGANDASFLLEVYDTSGNLIQSGSFPVPSQRRISQLLTQYFPKLPAISSGYFRISSPAGLLSFALFGTQSQSVLSAIPAQSAP